MSEAASEGAGRIRSRTADGVCRIVIDHPRRRNAMSFSMWGALADAVEAANASPDARVLVLSGAGEAAFVSGADISEFGAARSSPEAVARYEIDVTRAQVALMSSPRPTLAAIRGVCMGGGMTLALACDLRYAAADARFRMPAGRLGVGYERGGLKRFADMLGPARTADLFLTARIFDGREAARIGFVQEVFEAADFADAVEERIAQIAANAPLTLSAVKATLRHLTGEAGAPDAAAVDAAVQACFDSADYAEGRAAFAARRPPRFSGV